MSKIKNMTLWEDVPVEIYHKCWHIHKINGKFHRDFTKDYGDLPLGSMNMVTGEFEPCLNQRGMAYAKRKDQRYRKKRRKSDFDI